MNRETEEKAQTDIQVTQELLRKTAENLTDAEKTAVDAYNKKFERVQDAHLKIEEDIMRLCPILCGGDEHRLIPSAGWAEPVRKLCFALEKLNVEYKKYGLYVDVAQSKSKFGTLCFYYDIHERPAWFVRTLSKPFESFVNFCRKHVDFKPEYIVDKAFYNTVEWDEIDRKTYMSKLSKFGKKLRNHKTVNVKKSYLTIDILTGDNVYYDAKGKRLDPRKDTLFIKDPKTEKYYRSYLLGHCQTGHYEVRKHRIIHKFMNFAGLVSGWIHMLDPKPSREAELMREVFYEEVYELVRKAETECEGLCEWCGGDISGRGRSFTKHGWITYLCRECACASGCDYDDGENVYNGMKRLKKGKIENV